MVDLVDVNTNDVDIIKYIIKFLILIEMVVTKEFLSSSNVPDIGSIPISSEDYINKSRNITQYFFESFIFPEVLLHLQQELKSCLEKLSHQHPKPMFRLAKFGVIP